MTLDEMAALFKKHSDEEYLNGAVLSETPKDIKAFERLQSLVPSSGPIISGAGHDEIYLSTVPEDLAAVASEDDVIFLLNCGVSFDEDLDSFSMFV